MCFIKKKIPGHLNENRKYNLMFKISQGSHNKKLLFTANYGGALLLCCFQF